MGDREDKIAGFPHDYAPKSYNLSGKIMLSAIVILFAVVILIICLHIYARWYLLRARRRHNLRRRTRRTHFVFSDQTPSATTIVVPSRGINASVLKSLPIFTYSSATHDEVLECPVCLSEFEENEKGRILPKCNHCFHIDCIDMWFHSHSTCPLCRSPVEPEIPAPAPESLTENDSHVSIMISMGDFEDSEVGSSSGLCSSCQIKENEIGSSGFASSSSSSMGPLGSRRKPLDLMGVSIEVPKRTQSFRGLEEELSLGSPSGQGFKSPGSRIRSLRRILSREKKPAISSSSPSSPLPLSCSSVAEIDLEQAEQQESQSQQSSKEK